VNAEEGEFFVEGGDAVVAREVDAPGAVVRQHVSEQLRVAVEKVLGGRRVVEIAAVLNETKSPATETKRSRPIPKQRPIFGRNFGLRVEERRKATPKFWS